MKIQFLKLHTTSLQEQLKFYRDILHFPIIEASGQYFQVQIGYTVLEFEKKSAATPYHIAFHIPPGQEHQALEWLKKRISLLKDGENELIDFPAWNARSLYFYDADKNIVEFISRKNLYPKPTSVFSESNIIELAEIGLATENVKETFQFLNRYLALEKFTGDYDTFCATGDDEGLFIVINLKKKQWFPSNDIAFPSGFEIELSHKAKIWRMSYKNERLEIL